MTTKQQAIAGLLTEFPNAATKTLACTAIKRWPALFVTLEAARSAIRYARGACGSKRRKVTANREHFRAPQASGDPFSKLPTPKETLAKWDIFQIAGPVRALLLSDIHIPYHNEAALRLALNYGVEQKANLVLLNGDLGDFFSLSDWEKDPRERDFPGELKAVKEFLACVRAGFPRARIVYKLGNHEERYVRYMRLKAPEFLSVADFQLSSVLGLRDLGIELVENRCPIRIGPLNVLHGHEYQFAISNPVNPARGLFLRAKVNAVCGHFHQTSQHSERTLEQKVVSTWSTGCLCDLHPEYRPLNSWNLGFLFATVDAANAFQVHNLRVIDGKIWN